MRAGDARVEVLPHRWVVESTLAWMGRNRRLAKHFECLAATALAYLQLAIIQLMLRRLARTERTRT